MGLASVDCHPLLLAGGFGVSTGKEKIQMSSLVVAIPFWRVSEVSNTDVGCLQPATIRARDWSLAYSIYY